jgi:hypothetical protein
MVTQIVFKNGVELVVEHDEAPAIDEVSMHESYKVIKYDGSHFYTLSFFWDEVLYKKCFDNCDDYTESVPA